MSSRPDKFFQDPPSLPQPFDNDWLLQTYLARVVPQPFLDEIFSSLRALGEVVKHELDPLVASDRANYPLHVPYDAWGQRIDRIDVTAVWKRAKIVACQFGLVGMPYERKFHEYSRVAQAAHLYLFAPSSDVYSCPLAMSDGAARALSDHARERFGEVVFRLTTRNPELVWTAGQWMTERTGGSDVSRTETEARPLGDGTFSLHGTKWFTSAIASEMALLLARPEGAGAGSRALALFYAETRRTDGTPNGLSINRLKDKLGTRKLPTAELTLDGMIGVPVAGIADGVRNISPVLNVTRFWNAVCSIAGMQRGLSLAQDYAKRRIAFGAPLTERPLHQATLADLYAEFAGCFLLVMRLAELAGAAEGGPLSDDESALYRLLTPLAKLYCGKQAVMMASEIVESFGGAGYVEDTGIPTLLRDAQVLSIWEGTTNVLSVDALKVLAHSTALPALVKEVDQLVSGLRDARLQNLARASQATLQHAIEFLQARAGEPPTVEAEARRLAFSLSRALASALLCREADHALTKNGDARLFHCAMRFTRAGLDRLPLAADAPSLDEARAILG